MTATRLGFGIERRSFCTKTHQERNTLVHAPFYLPLCCARGFMGGGAVSPGGPVALRRSGAARGYPALDRSAKDGSLHPADDPSILRRSSTTNGRQFPQSGAVHTERARASLVD